MDYFFAYNNASDFVSGYSTSYINFENNNEYHNSISNINLVKNDIIKKLNESIINSRRHTIFREIKRESEISRNSGTNYLNTDNLYLQRDLQVECRNYNKCINKYKKKQRKLKTIKENKEEKIEEDKKEKPKEEMKEKKQNEEEELINPIKEEKVTINN